MSFAGRKVADIYAELHLDDDTAKAALRAMGSAMGADADQAGRDLGKKMSDGLAREVEASSQRLVKARREESKATDAVQLAELRLSEARDKDNQKASTLLALEQRLAQANQRLADSHDRVTKATASHADAEKRLAEDIDNVARKALPNADQGGQDLGDKLSQGIHLSIVRNSPLIVAAVGAALVAGAPLMMAAATGLFAGIGIVAAAQSQQVQQVWRGVWQQVQEGVTSAAGPIETSLMGIAGSVSRSFGLMQSQIGDAFSASAPQITVFANGILALTENALPGLVRAVQAGMPVTQGLADLLAKTGTGLSDFFDRISSHGPAAGQVFSGLGTTVGTLLPMLGELLGQGAELGAAVLPLLNGSLSIMLKGLTLLGPLLPVVSAGLLGMKVASLASGWLTSLSKSLATAAADGGAFSGMAGRASSAISGFAAGLPAIATSVAILGTLWSQTSAQIDKWASALEAGGQSAATANKELSDAHSRSILDAHSLSDAWGIVKGAFADGAAQIKGYSSAQDEANQKAKDYLASLDPLARAQQAVTVATNDLNAKVQEYGADSPQAAAASADLASKQADLAQKQDELKLATEGVTQALADQANQARSRVDATFAYQQSVLQVKEAQDKLNEAMTKAKPKASEIEGAQLALNRAYEGTVTAAGDLARSNLPATMDDTQKSILGAKAELDQLNSLIAQGVSLPPSMEEYRQHLIQITGQANGAKLAQSELAGAIGELGFAVTSMPDGKAIQITAPTDELKAKLADLGFTVKQLPGGKIEVTADSDKAKGVLGDLSNQLVGLNSQKTNPTVDANIDPFTGKLITAESALSNLAAQKPTPVADLATNMFGDQWQAAMNNLATLNGQRPTPVAQMANGPFASIFNLAMNQVATLDGQRPTPVAGLNDQASWGLIGIKGHIDSLYNKTVTITTQHVDIGVSGRGTAGQATGGNVGRAVRGFGAGGAPYRRWDGRIVGPGGPTDDIVSAVTDTGEPLRVSNAEWIVNGFVSAQQGDAKMAALNAGQATIVPTSGRTRGYASSLLNSAATASAPSAGGGRSITVQQLDVHLQGMYDVRDRAGLRQLGSALRQVLIDLERETS